MIHQLKQAWSDYVLPIMQRPRALQMAALCHRTKAGQTEVLLITSRDTGRWIIPKGWPIRGLDAPETALQEAWEEAGVLKAALSRKPIGSYTYDKIRASGLPVPVETLVYPVAVEKLAKDFPEAQQRTRKWMRPAEAAELVDEPGLRAILRTF